MRNQTAIIGKIITAEIFCWRHWIISLKREGRLMGLLPLMKGVSFEGHIAGAVAGISVAFLHKSYLQATAPKKIILPPSPQEDPLNAHENPWWVPPPPPKDLIDFINQLHQQQNPTNPAITPNENQQQNPRTPLEIKYIIIMYKIQTVKCLE